MITAQDFAREVAKQQQDSARWRWMAKNASIGFDGPPSFAAVLRIPVYDISDHTIEDIVDRALRAESGEEA